MALPRRLWHRQVVGFLVLLSGTSVYNEILRSCLPAAEPRRRCHSCQRPARGEAPPGDPEAGLQQPLLAGHEQCEDSGQAGGSGRQGAAEAKVPAHTTVRFAADVPASRPIAAGRQGDAPHARYTMARWAGWWVSQGRAPLRCTAASDADAPPPGCFTSATAANCSRVHASLGRAVPPPHHTPLPPHTPPHPTPHSRPTRRSVTILPAALSPHSLASVPSTSFGGASFTFSVPRNLSSGSGLAADEGEDEGPTARAFGSESEVSESEDSRDVSQHGPGGWPPAQLPSAHRH